MVVGKSQQSLLSASRKPAGKRDVGQLVYRLVAVWLIKLKQQLTLCLDNDGEASNCLYIVVVVKRDSQKAALEVGSLRG